MSTYTVPFTYLVFLPGLGTARTHQANRVVIEPSGALGLYGRMDDGSALLLEAYAPGAWRFVEKQPAKR